MISNYLKIALRNIYKYKGYSFINIFGLATGMSVAILIGLWIYDELSYDKHHANYDRIAQVMQHRNFNGKIATHNSMPAVMAEEIRNNYGSDFKYVMQSSWTSIHILTNGEKKLSKTGNFFEPQVIDMLSLKMLKGTQASLNEPSSIILSESFAKSFFGDVDPIDKIIKLDNQTDVKVTGVYEDLPYNSSFRSMHYVLPWQLYLNLNDWIKKMEDPWDSNFSQTFVQIADNADMEAVSKKIVDIKRKKTPRENSNAQVFLHPMSKWYLFPEFKNGQNTGGRIEFVWLFGIIGIFVLLLACINFMNLSTARSEKRAKEVGIRKSIGSVRSQLIIQFFSESLLVVALAFFISLAFVYFLIPSFNELADKKISILWTNPIFWMLGITFSIITGLIAGSYPALYLSSFQPVKVLKGTFRVGRFASIPRKVLVVLQFTVSITLIIGTIIVFRQIQHAKNRPVGYNRDGLINIYMMTDDIHKHFDVIRNELINSAAILEMTESGSPTTEVWNTNGGFNWEGKDPNLSVDFPNNGVTHSYGKTVGWQFKEGRDFSKEFATDSSAFVVNESAVKFMGLNNPVGKFVKWNGKNYKIIGVIKDMVVQSPYELPRGSFFHISKSAESIAILKLNPEKNSKESLDKIEAVLKKYNPAAPFEYQFVDQEYARKFGDEERIGKLATFFAILAIFISCMGLFGLASFVAEQRTKEIGVRKVLGASVLNLWQLLSKDFLILVIISCFIAIPIAYFYLNNWLQRYDYRTDISLWVFVVSVAGALLITLLTVSFQAIKAAIANPVKSLKTE